MFSSLVHGSSGTPCIPFAALVNYCELHPFDASAERTVL